jgi:cellulose synthase/poly-beta-1,6-N-acetylglucosamine synthase-like glycosyltransferase
MIISYAVTVCNELEEVQELLPHLLEFKRSQDEVVVLLDTTKSSLELINYLKNLEGIKLTTDKFNGHFANWKNKLTDLCTGDYVFQIDADETLSDEFIKVLPELLEENSEVELFWVPRANYVEGLTQEHIMRWGWNVTDDGLINWPDLQSRLYKNVEYIRWENKVHEKITGFKTVAVLPTGFNLLHIKDIKRQEKQNNYYNTL